MHCWKCGTELEDPPSGKLPFRATCDHCTSWLHCCKNCNYYQPGLSNDCKMPGTEYVADREGSNFCEEFQLKGEAPGEERSQEKKDKFKDLFKD